MERAQYAKTSDGVNIAYYVLGTGRPFLQMQAIPFSSTPGHSRVPEWDAWNQQIVRRGMLVRYDCRGAALSDRDVADYSLDAWVLDLEAVVEALHLDRFTLFAPGFLAVPVAIAYAARWPQRVSHLILWQAVAEAARLAQGTTAILNLMSRDWKLFSETIAHIVEDWSEHDTASVAAALIREHQTPQGLSEAFRAGAKIDVSGLLPEVKSPTLVLHRRDSNHDMSESRKVASLIPNARLVIVEGSSGSWALQHPEAVLQAVDEFLAEGDEAAPTPQFPSGTAVILFADIVDSTRLTEEIGDAAFRAKARDLDAALRGIISEHAGTAIEGKLLGDGVLAVFTSAREAIEAALASGRVGNDAGLPLHLGMHAGDVIREENNVYGGAVNIASRISGLSAPGEVLVSETVRSLARTSAGVAFEDKGRRRLKGVGELVRIFAVRQA